MANLFNIKKSFVWTDLHLPELEEDWKLARESKTIREIEPLR